jgi:uncharacterized membrane protein YphA (DoxX/SURF4 family)
MEDFVMNTFAATSATTTTTSRLNTVQSLLRYTYGLVPIVAGLDKFTHMLTNWNKYLAPVVTDIIPLEASTFMYIVGVIEIIAGVLVLIKPKIGALIVGFWLIGIAINLVLTGQYFDIAVRDVVMSIGAFSLYLLIDDKTEH